MIACFAGALSYPIQYLLQKNSNEADMEALREMRRSALEDGAEPSPTTAEHEGERPDTELTASPTSGSVSTEAAVADSVKPTVEVVTKAPTEAETSNTQETDSPGANDRYRRERKAVPYPEKETVMLETDNILPEYREIYEQNNDLVGWLNIPDTQIDYPVLQNEVRDYYLTRDFYGNPNTNGQLILDSACDPWTPSYNLVISGHNMKSGEMFGNLEDYASKSYWRDHKLLTYDSLLREGTYVVFAAFYSADYDVDEEGFRYNADIQYRLDAEVWLEEVFANRIYDTGIEAEFGDEFLTLTTCFYQRENGRFVVVARRVREGEVFE